jgi:hypothetical protein
MTDPTTSGPGATKPNAEAQIGVARLIEPPDNPYEEELAELLASSSLRELRGQNPVFEGPTHSDIWECLATTDIWVRTLELSGVLLGRNDAMLSVCEEATALVANARGIFEKLVGLLGRSTATDAWESICKRTNGRPPGHQDPVGDALLMQIYDDAARADPEAAKSGRLPRILAEWLSNAPKLGALGRSAQSQDALKSGFEGA